MVVVRLASVQLLTAVLHVVQDADEALPERVDLVPVVTNLDALVEGRARLLGLLRPAQHVVEGARDALVGVTVGLQLLQQDVPQHLLDRKSTRLNSSHVKISYAVFCLKKKTKTTT